MRVCPNCGNRAVGKYHTHCPFCGYDLSGKQGDIPEIWKAHRHIGESDHIIHLWGLSASSSSERKPIAKPAKDGLQQVCSNVMPLTLGIEFPKGQMKPVIPGDTVIPVSKNATITTTKDHQSSMIIRVLQGDGPVAADNHVLAIFILDGIPPAPRGVPRIEVSFRVGADGILNLSAREKSTAEELKISITYTSGLSSEDVEKMRQEVEDATRKEKLELMKRAKCPDCGHSLSFDYWVLLWRCTNRKCKGKRSYTYRELCETRTRGKNR
jgi:hypothetical protein